MSVNRALVRIALSALPGALLVALAACQSSTAPPAAKAAPSANAAAPAVAAPNLAAPKAAPVAKAAVLLPSMDLPPGPLYTCDVGGVRSVIEFPGNTEQLCRRHPEMGPCQYERNSCRRSGGRVYTTKGDEVTAAVEAAYDEKVIRVRFRADDGAAKR